VTRRVTPIERPRAAAQRRRRQAAWRRGHLAELMCLWQLRLKGYRVLARRYRVPVGEVDLIVRRGGIVAAIEVKARADVATAGAAIAPRQRRRIVRALAHFVAGRPDLAPLAFRFDVMLVAPRRLPMHLIDAWRADG
jgi:putative endonuclease